MKTFYLILTINTLILSILSIVCCYIVLNNDYSSLYIYGSIIFSLISYGTSYNFFNNYLKYKYGIYA